MLVDVVLLRAKGVRLRPSELEPGVRGHLLIEHDLGTSTSFKRPMLVAQLIHEIGVQRTRQNLLVPIWGVQIVQLSDSGVLTIEGTELASDVDAKRVTEYRQIWRCTVLQQA